MFGLGTPTLDALLRNRLIRSYPFSVAPASVRNTFPVGFVITNDLPAVYFESNGAVSETDKILELRVERVDYDNVRPAFFAPGSTVDGDFLWQIDCQLWGYAATPANVSSSAWHGIEVYSAGQNIPGQGGYANAVCYLQRRYDDPTRWRLVTTDTITVNSIDFQVPTAGGLEGGHRVTLVLDPFGHTVTAIVDGVPRARHVGQNGYPMGAAGTIRVGLVVFSGTQTAATKLYAGWSSMLVQDIGTGALGSGLV